jgi:hypothetical protein
MNDTPKAEAATPPAKSTARHHVWDDSWIGVFILMLIAAALGGLVSRLWPGGDGLFSTPAGELSEKVAALDARVMQLTTANTTAPSEEIDAVRERVGKLEERVKAAETALASNPQNPGSVAAIAPGAAASLDALAKQVQELQARFAVMELGATAAAAPGVSAGTGVGAGVKLAQTEMQTFRDDLAKAKEATTALTARFDELKTKVDGAADPTPLVAALRTDLDAVKARIGIVEKADVAGSARKAALGAAVASLSRAAQSGLPFASELAVVRGLQPADAGLAALASFADKGAPVIAALQGAFPAAADAAVNAERDSKAGEGIDRLWSGVTSLVTVRATGTPGGTDTASVLARAETKLKAGDLGAAYSETSKLQGPARTAMESWRRQADTRIRLDAAIASLSRTIADSLARNAATPADPVSTP